MKKRIFILFTMDVEPVKQHALWTGPEHAELSEKYIRCYWDICREYGFTPSFFIHPEAARLHSGLFREYQEQGAALGLHVHSTKFHYPEYQYEFGYYSAGMQRDILIRAAGEWEIAMGARPEYFRPGAFSANDSTARVLVSLGFRGGSLTIPGRIWPGRYCVWAGADPYPHRMHPDFRCGTGDMEFADIPLSVDFSSPSRKKGFFCYEDLRPSGRKSSVETILSNIVGRIAEDSPDIPVIQIITHNDQPFDNSDHESRKRLDSALAEMESICARSGFTPESATIADITDMVLGSEPVAPGEWNQDNDVYF